MPKVKGHKGVVFMSCGDGFVGLEFPASRTRRDVGSWVWREMMPDEKIVPPDSDDGHRSSVDGN